MVGLSYHFFEYTIFAPKCSEKFTCDAHLINFVSMQFPVYIQRHALKYHCPDWLFKVFIHNKLPLYILVFKTCCYYINTLI